MDFNGQIRSNPRILCLHGGGTCSSIFRIQVGSLERMLAKYVDFVYVDAPFECPPGPGVLPIFAGAGPFYKWTSGPDHERPNDEKPSDFSIIQDKIRTLTEEDGPFIGILAFSQGVRTAAALLSRVNPTLQHDGLLKTTEERAWGFSFGILIAGTFPPLHSGIISNSEIAEDSAARITVPTLHVLGKHDPFRAESLQVLRQCCEPLDTTVVNFNGNHEVPTNGEALDLIAGHVKDFVNQGS